MVKPNGHSFIYGDVSEGIASFRGGALGCDLQNVFEIGHDILEFGKFTEVRGECRKQFWLMPYYGWPKLSILRYLAHSWHRAFAGIQTHDHLVESPTS
jgi:hypothetical protein